MFFPVVELFVEIDLFNRTTTDEKLFFQLTCLRTTGISRFEFITFQAFNKFVSMVTISLIKTLAFEPKG